MRATLSAIDLLSRAFKIAVAMAIGFPLRAAQCSYQLELSHQFSGDVQFCTSPPIWDTRSHVRDRGSGFVMLALSLADNDLKRTSALHDEVATSTKITADSAAAKMDSLLRTMPGLAKQVT